MINLLYTIVYGNLICKQIPYESIFIHQLLKVTDYNHRLVLTFLFLMWVKTEYFKSVCVLYTEKTIDYLEIYQCFLVIILFSNTTII